MPDTPVSVDTHALIAELRADAEGWEQTDPERQSLVIRAAAALSVLLEERDEATRRLDAGSLPRLDRALRAEAALDTEHAARVRAEEALRDAKTTIRRAQMRYEHPLTEHLARCECVSCDGIRAIDEVLAAREALVCPGESEEA